MRYLKNWPYYILAAFIVGLACFAVMFWLLNFSYKDSLFTAISVATAGLFAEIAKLYFMDRQNRKS